MARARSANGRFASRPASSTPRAKSAQSRVRRVRRRRNPAPLGAVANGPLGSDLLHEVLPAFGGYAATRLVSRLVYTQASKRWPNASRHLSVLSSAGSFLAAWFLVHRIRRLEKYHGPIVTGSAIAALQSIVQAYLPKFGWLVSDYQPTAGSASQPLPAGPTTRPAVLTAPGPRAPLSPAFQQQAQRTAAAGYTVDGPDDDVDFDDAELGTLGGSTLDNMPDDLEFDEAPN